MHAERSGQEAGTRAGAEGHARSTWRRIAAVLGVGLAVSLVLPLVPIVLGVAVLVVLAVHTWSPELRPWLEPVVRIPIAGPRQRHTRLAILGATGVLLVLTGSVSATLRGSWRGAREQRAMQRAARDESITTLIDRAEVRLSTGDVAGAELALLDARTIVGLDPEREELVDELLDRIRRSGDVETIRAILDGLSPEELEALTNGTAVPDALDFGRQTLTYRAVELALFLLDDERRAPASR